MKKRKRRINTFKNWLLARDSSSGISTKSNYSGFLESKKNSDNGKNDNDLFFRSSRRDR